MKQALQRKLKLAMRAKSSPLSLTRKQNKLLPNVRGSEGTASLSNAQRNALTLSTVLFHMGVATSISQAYQLINHKHIKVSSIKIRGSRSALSTIPALASLVLKPYDLIQQDTTASLKIVPVANVRNTSQRSTTERNASLRNASDPYKGKLQHVAKLQRNIKLQHVVTTKHCIDVDYTTGTMWVS